MKKSSENFLLKLNNVSNVEETAELLLKQITNSDNPLEIVETLGPHDALLLYAQADEEQRADLLTLLNQEQFDSLVDLYCWDGYYPSIEKVIDFISPLVQTGLGGTLRAFDRLTEQLRTLLLKKYTIIHLRENKDDFPPEVPDSSELITTSDSYYFIEIPEATFCPDTVMEIIRALLYKPFEDYQKEFEAARHEFVSQLEETELKWKTARMADYGFCSYKESRSILMPVDPQTVLSKIESKKRPPLNVNIPLPVVYSANLTGNDLLEKAMNIIFSSTSTEDGNFAESLKSELGAMVSQFLTALKCDLADMSMIAKYVKIARDTLGLGLEIISKGNVEKAATVLANSAPGIIVQVAMGKLHPIRTKAQNLKKNQCVLGSIILDDIYQMILELLSIEIPLWYSAFDENLSTSSAIAYPAEKDLKAISSYKMLANIDTWLEEIDKQTELIAFCSESFLPLPESEYHFSSIIMTLLANIHSTGSPSLAPISAQAALKFTDSFSQINDEQALLDAFSVLGSIFNVEKKAVSFFQSEQDPASRCIMRMILIGKNRLIANDPKALIS